MWIDVINVGDGACAAIKGGYPRRGGLTIVDCGTHNQSRVFTKPGAAAATHLGGRLRDLDTMVVTHFDADHWHGLVELADAYGSVVPAGREIRILYAGMPDLGIEMPAAQVRAGLMAMISTRDDDPLNLIRLKKKWSQVGQIRASALYRGDRFQANGRTWVVHWPPREISTVRGRKYATAIQKMRSFAEELAAEGHTTLRDQWNEAYEMWDQLNDHVSDVETSPGDTKINSQSDEISDVGEVDPEPHDSDPAALQQIPKDRREDFQGLLREMRDIDNYFSLVISVEDEFIAFGDIEGTALRALVAETDAGVAMKQYYNVMLAPHHGSHDRHASRLPGAQLCILQNGSKHQSKSTGHTDRHHNVHQHLSTWMCGTIRSQIGYF